MLKVIDQIFKFRRQQDRLDVSFCSRVNRPYSSKNMTPPCLTQVVPLAPQLLRARTPHQTNGLLLLWAVPAWELSFPPQSPFPCCQLKATQGPCRSLT